MSDEQGDIGNYELLERSIRRAPRTWLPGLLTAAIEASVAKEVFITAEGGLERFVENAVKRIAKGTDDE